MNLKEKGTVMKVLNLMLFYRHQPDYTEFGLCNWVKQMYYNNIISEEEKFLTEGYIKRNRPSNWHYDVLLYRPNHVGYYWNLGDVQPRVRWIRRHINSLAKSIVNERYN